MTFDSTSCLVISPHLDDAVFGCGDIIAEQTGTQVVSVFAGLPRSTTLQAWDRECGFRSAAQVMPARRREDARALALLRARAVWLPFLDGQYSQPPDPRAIIAALRRALERTRPRRVLIPLGLFHSDHRLASDAALDLRAKVPWPSWYAYADALYRFIPGECAARIEALALRGLRLKKVSVAESASARKRAAVACYRSQLKALAAPGRVSIERLYATEQLWRLYDG